MSKVVHGKRYYKQMSLEVAVRNPERYYDILKCFSKFEGQILNDELILKIYVQLYLDNAIESNDLDDNNLNPEYLKNYIIEHNSHNNEWGFPTGYQAAFVRYLKTLSEFGFIYSQYNEVFQMSKISKLVINNDLTLSEAFAIQSFKFWRKSPYRRVLNDFNFFTFIYKLLILRDKNQQKLSYPQFMVCLFSEDGDINYMNELLSNAKIGNDLNAAYNFAFDQYNLKTNNHQKVNKFKTAFRDYGNTVFKVLQLTGFITVENKGVLLISLNKNRIDLLNSLLNEDFIIEEEAKENELLYYSTLGDISQKHIDLLINEREKEDFSTMNYNSKIPGILEGYNLTQDIIMDELKRLSTRKKTQTFWYMAESIKFELLLTLFLYTCYGDRFEYKPNFKCDDAGIPYSHAPGLVGDIEVKNSSSYWLIEATLITSKEQQANYETINLFRHLEKNVKGAKYLSLVAPYIHQDTELLIKTATLIVMFETDSINLFSMPQTIEDFIESSVKTNNFIRIKEYSIVFIKKIQEWLQNKVLFQKI